VRALVFGLVLSLPALAVQKGGSLYVSAKEVTLRAKPKDNAAKVATLRAGTEVKWNGGAERDRRFHSVTTADGKTGFLLLTELSPNKPQLELDVSGKPVGPGVPFAQQGFTKCDMGAAVRVAPASAQEAEAEAQLQEAEAINREAATPEALKKKQQELRH
jgi:uncharacterized protein YgiM (DUF1202 family)